jgi:hypothetical protein
MQSKSAYLFQIFTFLCMFNLACTKKNTPSPTPPPGPIKDVPVVPPPVAEKSHFPAKLESESLIITFKYLTNSGNVTDIESSDGTKEMYMYNDKDQPTKYDRYEKKERKYTVSYILDQDGLVIRANQFKVESNGAVLTPAGYYRIEYDTEKRIIKVSWYDNTKQLFSEETRTYSDDRASLKISTTGLNAGVVDYTFDSKKAWCSSINYNQVLSIESLPGLLLSNTGNAVKVAGRSTEGQTKTFTYTYDADSFPTSWVETDPKGSKKTFKLTYR